MKLSIEGAIVFENDSNSVFELGELIKSGDFDAVIAYPATASSRLVIEIRKKGGLENG